MKHDEVTLDALSEGSRDQILHALNTLRFNVVDDMICDRWHALTRLYAKINDSLCAYQEFIEEEQPNRAFIAGQLYSLQGVIRVLRELRPSPEELDATNPRFAKDVMRLLLTCRSISAGELREAISFPDNSALSKLGKQLEKAGLLRVVPVGKYVRYELTTRGYAVARELERRREAAQLPDTASLLDSIRDTVRDALQDRKPQRQQTNAALRAMVVDAVREVLDERDAARERTEWREMDLSRPLFNAGQRRGEKWEMVSMVRPTADGRIMPFIVVPLVSGDADAPEHRGFERARRFIEKAINLLKSPAATADANAGDLYGNRRDIRSLTEYISEPVENK